MSALLSNRVALITGAGKRLGRAVAVGLAEQGADVVIHYRSSEAEAREAVAQIEKLGRRSIALQADLAKVSDLPQLFHKVEASFGRLDLLVNSAANFLQTEFASTTEKVWDASLDTNLKSVFFCCQAAAPLLKKTNGAIVNFADIGGILGCGSAFILFKIFSFGSGMRPLSAIAMPPLVLVEALLAAALIGGFSALVPARSAARRSIVDALRTVA